MRRLKLDLDDLRVESFETTPEIGDTKGTVLGYGATDWGNTCAASECGTCVGTCFGGSCVGTCAGTCGNTCGSTCAGTCGNSCGGGCGGVPGGGDCEGTQQCWRDC